LKTNETVRREKPKSKPLSEIGASFNTGVRYHSNSTEAKEKIYITETSSITKTLRQK